MPQLVLSSLSLVALASSARAQPASDTRPQQDTTAQPSSATAPSAPGVPAASPPAEAKPAEAKPAVPRPATPVVSARWDSTLYGWVELDAIHDSTQSFNDLAGNAAIARPGTYAGEHARTTMAVRNSRIGYKLAAPTYDDIAVTGQLEMDFLGNQPPGVSEAAFFTSPTLRIRHMNLKLETPAVDVLLGQAWQLFGWQSYFHPNTVELQGVPGQIYSRSPQIRISKKIQAGDVSVVLAVAAARPPQRDSAVPDGHAGIKLDYDGLKAYHTMGGATSALDSASLGVSVVGRRFAVAELTAAPVHEVSAHGYGVSIDALIPVVPATKDHTENSLTLTADFVTGAGIADLYAGLTGGVSEPALPNPMKLSPAPTYTPNVDTGLVMFTPDGKLHPVQWTSFMVGAQYYLPPSGKVFISGNYSHMSSDNADAFGDPKKVFDEANWADGNLSVDVTPAVRLGLELAWFHQTYVDGTDAADYRVQFSGWLIF